MPLCFWIAPALKCGWLGVVLCRADRTGVLHAAFGKCSFPKAELYANLGALTAAVLAARPKGIKGGGTPQPHLSSVTTSCPGSTLLVPRGV